ncbi:MAG: hypothetical protein JWM34_3736 [Ilumatobacteraceae bacterium]|nr:hypothetical protein [Ilumatobacteraceae bacterium]
MGVLGPLTRLAATATVTALSVTVLVACDSAPSSNTAETSRVVVSSSTPPTTTVPPTSSEAKTTSGATTLTIEPTASSVDSLPPSTAAPTTIAVPSTAAAADPEAAVRSAIALAESSYSACLTAMPSCDPATLAVARAGDLLQGNVDRVNEWNAQGYTVRDRDQFRYVVESVTLGQDNTTASAVVCIADGSKLVLPNAGPAGVDVVVDDTFASGVSTWDMRLDGDGVWRVYGAPSTGPAETSDVCPPA